MMEMFTSRDPPNVNGNVFLKRRSNAWALAFYLDLMTLRLFSNHVYFYSPLTLYLFFFITESGDNCKLIISNLY